MIMTLTIFLCALLFILFWGFVQTIGLVREYIHVNKNKNYIELQNYFFDTAYDIVYKDQILAYTASGYKVSGDHLATTQKNFIKLATQLMGPINKQYLISFYGDEQSLFTSCILWFRSRLDSDEIYKFMDDKQTAGQQSAGNILDDTFYKASGE